ncbi:hypothetical protein Hanom_Chr12g01128161 [Helianthus anomalus]
MSESIQVGWLSQRGYYKDTVERRTGQTASKSSKLYSQCINDKTLTIVSFVICNNNIVSVIIIEALAIWRHILKQAQRCLRVNPT